MFTIEQIRTFVAVAEAQHFTRAAAQVHLSQGAVTQQVQLLERGLGLRLFDRTARGATLSDAGRTLLSSAQAVLRAAEVVGEVADDIVGMRRGHLTIGCSQTVAAHYLPPVLAEFVRAHPGVEVSIEVGNTSTVTDQVRLRAIDVGVVEGEVDAAGLEEYALFPDEVLLVGAAAGFGSQPRGHRVKVSDHVYLAREKGSGTEALAPRLLGRDYALMRRLELGSLDAVRGAAMAGLGLAVLPRVAIHRELAVGDLRAIAGPVVRVISGIRPAAPDSPAARSFWDMLCAARALTGEALPTRRPRPPG